MNRVWRIIFDLKYIILNHFVCHIPSWYIRKFFYCIFGLKIGKNSRIGINTKIIQPSRIVIGNNTIINEMCYLDGRGGLTVGDNCSISLKTTIITASHKANSEIFEYYENKVIIKNNVWIGTGAIVLDGSILNNNVIIGAGSVLKGNTEENGIYVGNPSKKIKERKLSKKYEINYHPFFR